MDEIIELEKLNLDSLEPYVKELFYMRKLFQKQIHSEPDYLKINKKKLKEYISYLQQKYDYQSIIQQSIQQQQQQQNQNIKKSWISDIFTSKQKQPTNVNNDDSINNPKYREFQFLVAGTITGLEKLLKSISYPYLIVQPLLKTLMKDPEDFDELNNDSKDPFLKIQQLIERIQKDYKEKSTSYLQEQINKLQNMENNNINNQENSNKVNSGKKISFNTATIKSKKLERTHSQTSDLQDLEHSQQNQQQKKNNSYQQQYQEDLIPTNILEILKNFEQYYQLYREMWRGFLTELQNIEPKNLVKAIQQFEQNFPSVEVRAPFLGIYLISKTQYIEFLEKQNYIVDQQQNQENQNSNSQYFIEVQRIGKDFIYSKQKNFIIYVLMKFIFGLNILPSLVIRAQEQHQQQKISQNTSIHNPENNNIKDKRKKKTTFYQLSLQLDEEQQEYTNLNEFQVNGRDICNNENKINRLSYIMQLVGSLFATPLESYIPQYIVSKEGDILRKFSGKINEEKAQHSGIKNPLYFFKESLNALQVQDLGDFMTEFMSRNDINIFFRALTFLNYSEISDFKFDIKDGTYINSTLLQQSQLSSLFNYLRSFYQVFVWLQEVVFPVTKNVGLLQIVMKLSPIIPEFSERILSKTVKEHYEFMKKIAIEEFLQRNIKKKSLKKYIDSIKPFEEINIIKQLQYIHQEQSQNVYLNNKFTIGKWLSQIDLHEMSTVTNRTLILKAVSKNFFFQTYYTDSFFKDLHQSFNNYELWREVFKHIKNNPENGSIFMECMAFILKVNIQKIQEQDLFSTMEQFDDDSIIELKKWNQYLKNPNIIPDQGYPHNLTLLERALQFKKHNLALILLQNGHGLRIRQDTLLKYFTIDSLKVNTQDNINKQKEILEQLRLLHQSKVSTFEWERVWKQLLESYKDDQQLKDDEIIVYTEEFGPKILKKDLHIQIFDTIEETLQEDKKSIAKKVAFRKIKLGFEYSGIQQDKKLNPKYYLSSYLQKNTEVEIQNIQIIGQQNQYIVVQKSPKYPGLIYFYDQFSQYFNSWSRVKKVQGRINSQEYQFSQHLQDGKTLAQAFEKSNIMVESILESESLGERILMSMLLYEQEINLEDEVLQIHPFQKNRYRLVNISNSQCFQPSIIKKQDIWQLNIKNVLFCMDFMKNPISNSLIDKILKFTEDKDPEHLIRKLIYKLINYQQKQAERIQKTEKYFKNQSTFFNIIDEITDDNKVYMGIPLFKVQIQELYERFKKMIKILQIYKLQQQEELKKFQIYSTDKSNFNTNQQQNNNSDNIEFNTTETDFNDVSNIQEHVKKQEYNQQCNINLSYIDLLMQIDPQLAKQYKNLLDQKNLNLSTRFQLLCQNNDKHTFKGFGVTNQASFDDHFTIKNSNKQQFQEIDIDQIIRSFKHKGPTQILKSFKKYRQIYPPYITYQDQKPLNPAYQQPNYHQNQLKYCLNNVESNKQLLFFMKNLDFQDSPEEVQNNFLVQYQNWVYNFQKDRNEQVEHFIVQNMSALTFKKMNTYINLDRITNLSLINTPLLIDEDITNIFAQCPCLIYLHLQQLSQVHYIQESSFQKFSKTVKVQALKTLILINLPKLNTIDIHGTHIQQVKVDQCQKLESMYINSPNLKRVSVLNCPVFQKSLVSLFILEGIEFGTDEFTANQAFSGYLQQNEQNSETQLKLEDIISQIFALTFNSITDPVQCEILNIAFQKRDYTDVMDLGIQFNNFVMKKQQNQLIKLYSILRLRLSQIYLRNPIVKTIDFSNFPLKYTDISILLTNLANAVEQQQQDQQNQQKHHIQIKLLDFSGISDIFQVKSDLDPLCSFISKFKTQHKQLSVKLAKFGDKFISQTIESSEKIEKNEKGDQQKKNNNLVNSQNSLKIINSICSNNQIQQVDFSETVLDEEAIVGLLKNGVKVNSLTLNQSQINDGILKIIAKHISSNKYIKYLDISDNIFTSESLNIFIDSIQENYTLTFLKLDKNNLQNTQFQNLKKIKQLSLQQIRNLTTQDLENLNNLIKNQQLDSLDLSYTELNIQQLQIIQEGIQNSSTLKSLILKKSLSSDPHFKNSQILIINEILKKTMGLQELNLSQNNLGDQCLMSLGQGIVDNITLKVLLLQQDFTFDEQSMETFIKEYLANNINISVFKIDIPTQLSSIQNKVNEKKDIHQIEQDKILHYNNWQNIVKIIEEVLNDNIRTSCLQNIKKQQHSKNQQQLQDHDEEQKQNNQFSSPVFQSSLIHTKTSRQDKLDHFKIGLSIDGGGMKGVIPATLMDYISRETNSEMHEIFDCIGGTSIGGILALGSTGTLDGRTPITNTKTLINLFDEYGSVIFNNNKIIQFFNNVLRDKAKYDPSGLTSLMNQYFQNTTLADILPGTNVLVTSVKREINKEQGKNSAKIFRSKRAVFDQNKNFYMRDVARATSAAPTFFPSAEIKNVSNTKNYSLIDGGIGQNNPSKFVIDDVKKEALNSGNENNFFLVSLGTGVPLTSSTINKESGVLNIIPVIEGVMDSGMHYIDKDIEKNYAGHYVRAQTNIPLDKSVAELDNLNKDVIQVYKDSALECAIENFTQKELYGQFYDRSLCDWLAENTARKKDIYI